MDVQHIKTPPKMNGLRFDRLLTGTVDRIGKTPEGPLELNCGNHVSTRVTTQTYLPYCKSLGTGNALRSSERTPRVQ